MTLAKAATKAAPVPANRAKKQSIIPPAQPVPKTLPKDVQALVKQYQQERERLMNSLKGASDAKRQQVLRDLARVREELQGQLQEITAQAREQAMDMRSRFGGDFAPGSAAAGVPTSSGHGGRPRS
jgi:uncharacterized membrane protein YccC